MKVVEPGPIDTDINRDDERDFVQTLKQGRHGALRQAGRNRRHRRISPATMPATSLAPASRWMVATAPKQSGARRFRGFELWHVETARSMLARRRGAAKSRNARSLPLARRSRT